MIRKVNTALPVNDPRRPNEDEYENNVQQTNTGMEAAGGRRFRPHPLHDTAIGDGPERGPERFANSCQAAEKENQELRQAQASPAYGGQAPSNAATAGARPNQDPPQEGYRIGSLTTVTAAFRDGTLWFTTPNADFTMHPGFWMQLDNVFWNELDGSEFRSRWTADSSKAGNRIR